MIVLFNILIVLVVLGNSSRLHRCYVTKDGTTVICKEV